MGACASIYFSPVLLLTRWNSLGSSCMRLKLASLGLLVTASRRATCQQHTVHDLATLFQL
jgi:hypothetical protein